MMDALRSLPRNRPAAVLGHLPHIDLLQTAYGEALEKMGALAGWWGAHERGHNEWSGRHLAIFGGPYLKTEDQAAQYSAARVFALSAGMGPVAWPAWTGEMIGDVWVPEGTTEVRAGAPLPANSVIREWMLRRYVAAVVQAIGRVRGVWQTVEEPCEVWIFGGLPLFELWTHGIKIDHYQDDPSGWRTLEDHNKQQSLRARERLIEALEALESVGGAVGLRNINNYLHSTGRPGLSATTYPTLMKELGWEVRPGAAVRRAGAKRPVGSR